MKKLLMLGVLLSVSSANYAAEVVVVPIEKIYELPNMTKSQIYTGVRAWFAESFKSAQNVIQMDDKESGTIIGNGRASYKCNGLGDCLLYSSANMAFTLRVDIKDNKLRTTYSKVNLLMSSSNGESSGYIQKKQADNMTTQLTNLTDLMVERVKTNQTVSNDW